MTLRLRNTLSRRVEPVQPLEPGRVRMYTCGPTVYRYAHIGNLRSYLLADVIRRALLYHGLDVLHVKNVTDVGHLRDERFDRGEDRMLVQAGLERKSPAEIADAYEEAFHDDEAAVNILPAHVFPRATEHIDDMLALVERLEDLGHAYASAAGNVYYAVASFAGYGRLSGNTLDDLRAGHRGDIEPDKRDAADFALWKSAGPGRLLRWPSARWGEGSPGWHIECSAMALRHLGPRFDLHTGGIDNVFPHHEDEIAQSAPLVGGPPATTWVHGEHLLMAGHKMAKSAGNVQRITELAGAGVEPLAFRYLALTSRYGHKLNYSGESITGAAAGLASLRARLRALGPPPVDGPWAAPPVLRVPHAGPRPPGTAVGIGGHGAARIAPEVGLSDRAHRPRVPLSGPALALHDRFVAAVDDDLDLPAALAILREILRSDLDPDERRWLALDADWVLGLDLHAVWGAPGARGERQTAGRSLAAEPVPDEVNALLHARSVARAGRDFARADSLRRVLADHGWEVVDAPNGTSTVRRS